MCTNVHISPVSVILTFDYTCLFQKMKCQIMETGFIISLFTLRFCVNLNKGNGRERNVSCNNKRFVLYHLLHAVVVHKYYLTTNATEI